MAKANRICSISGCDNPHEAYGMCAEHYGRWKRHGDPLAGRASPGGPDKFISEVAVPFSGGECLIWPFAKHTHGYGQVRRGKRPEYVHRIVCELAHGSPPTAEHHAAHTCGKGHLGCVNPNHIRWATRSENQMDRTGHGTSNRGEQSGLAKLTRLQVKEILALVGKMPQAEIGRRYGVSQTTISLIHRRRNWAWLE